jgi:hypothetical protein
MAETAYVKVRGDWHPEVLANGQTMAPGEPFLRSLLDLDDDGDGRLLDRGIVIDALLPPVELEGDALTERARELDIKGRSKMSAEELRVAIAAEESEPPPATQPEPTPTPMTTEGER